MKLVVGLGNPGSEYEHTRHNVGFRVVDKLATKHGWKWSERRNRAILASGTIGLEKVVLAKPITFMNLSGQAVGELVRWYKIQPEDMLVVYDELDLPVGKVRLRARGSAAGHNGLEDIIHHLHTNAFPRLRVGIGRSANSHIKGKDHVLGIPSNDERILLEIGEDRAVEAIELVIRQGISTTMNVVNIDPEEAVRKEAERLQRQKERQEQARLKREAARLEQGAALGQFQIERETVSSGDDQNGPQPAPEGGRKGTPLLYTDESAI
jgi:peptidyl-tRNA hydrolase, PTH1 family